MDLETYRKRKGWTLEDVARFVSDEKLQIDVSTVSKHEMGKHLPRVDMLERYGRLTGGEVSMEDFVARHKEWRKKPRPRRVRQSERVPV